MPWPVHPNGLLGAQGDNDSYQVERSLRFNSSDSAYLNKTSGTSTDQNICTVSFWLKRVSLGIGQRIIEGRTANSDSGYGALEISSADKLVIGGFSTNFRITTQVLRDPSSWYHIVAAWDTSQATASNRIKVYINGVEITSFDTSNNPTQNTTIGINNNSTVMNIGRRAPSNDLYLSAYLAEIYFIDGQALTPSFFGETDPYTGRWKAKAYAGTYGTNGFYLKFADNSNNTAATLGKDSSPNGNNWTPNNFSVATTTLADKVANDSLVDSPTNYGTDTGVGGEVRGNYATLNPVSTIRSTIIDGNLRTNAGDRGSISTIGMTSGKWYCEMYITAIGAESSVGLSQGINIMNTIVGSTTDSYGYYFNGQKYNTSSGSAYGATYTTGDTIGVAFDASAGTLVFYKNGTSQGTAYSSLTSGPYYFAVEGRSSTSANDVTMNFGQQAWRYAPPAGFKALCVTNFPIPTIQKPSRYMDVLAYTGTGASNSISSLGFSPDLVWIKNRGGATSHALYDTTRLATKQLSSDTTGDEATSSTGLTAFGSNGFTLGTSTLVNTSGTQYVAWAWDEAPIAGMDIVDYTGNGANRTIAHTLGVAPKMVIVKARTTAGADQGWPMWHTSIANTTYLQLNSTSATATAADYWNSSSPTSSVFSVGTNAAVNANADTYIAYLFAEVDGFNKFGIYTGNGLADGTFVFTGHRPKWVMIKRTDSAIGAGWFIHNTQTSTFNLSANYLRSDVSNAEATVGQLDILSNGFKLRGTDVSWNGSGATYIFAAFAESPFKYARAR
jgi:hypothetical protein